MSNSLPSPSDETPMQALLRRQKEAFRSDLNPAHAVRVDRLNRLERMIEQHAENFARQIAADFGCRSPYEVTIAETMVVQGGLKHARGHLKRWMKTKRMPASLRYWPGRSFVRPQPLGVVGIISPWNYPLLLALSPLVGVLAAGNCALLKPSEQTPAFSAALTAALAEFFAPEEVGVVTGDAEVGRQFSALPFDHLVFTGSTAVGRLVAQAAARNLTPVTLELGGKSPVIIDSSCELPGVIDRLVWGKLLNAGQTCIAPDYALVPRARLDEFVGALRASMVRLYPGIAANPDYTSIVSERHYRRLLDLVAEARAGGAQVIEVHPSSEPSESAQRKFAPLILLDVDDSMRVMQEEIFGPVLPVVAYDTLEEAISYVNRHERPLALYWFGNDRRHCEQVISQTLSGGVSINETLLHLAQDRLPFGGVGASGQGHYHGESGFRQFSKEKPVFIQSRISALPLLYPPFKPSLGRLLKLLSRL